MSLSPDVENDLNQQCPIIFDDLWALSPMTREKAIKVITGILNRILENPAQEKFRRINMEVLAKKFAKAPAGNQILEACGFRSLTGTHLVLPESFVPQLAHVFNLFQQRKQEEEDKLARERARIAGESRAREEAFIDQEINKRNFVVNRERDEGYDRKLRQTRKVYRGPENTSLAPNRHAPGGNNPWNEENFAATRLALGAQVPEYVHISKEEELASQKLIHTIERVEMVLLTWLRPFKLNVHGDVLYMCARFVLWPCDFVFDNEQDQNCDLGGNVRLSNLRHTAALVNDTSTIVRASPWLREGEWRVRFRVNKLGRSQYIAIGLVTSEFEFDREIEPPEQNDDEENKDETPADQGDDDEDVVMDDVTHDDDDDDSNDDDESYDNDHGYDDIDVDSDDDSDVDYDMIMNPQSKIPQKVDLTQDVYQSYRDWYDYLQNPPAPGIGGPPPGMMPFPGPGMGPPGAPPPLPPGLLPGTVPFPGIFAPGGMWGGGMFGMFGPPPTNPRRTDEQEDGTEARSRSKLCRSGFCFGFNSKGHITQTTGETERCLDFVDDKSVRIGKGLVFGEGDEVEVMLELDSETCLKKALVRVNRQPQSEIQVGLNEYSSLAVAVRLVDQDSTITVLEVTELSAVE